MISAHRDRSADGEAMKTLCALIVVAWVGLLTRVEADPARSPPRTGTLKVAFVVSEGATVIDFAGPWDVFETVWLRDDRQVEEAHPFELFTVAPSLTPLHTSGSHRPGFTLVPDYDFASAPPPDIVVIGAQSGGPGLSEWLQKMRREHVLIMSVCTGAFKLARAGLLDNQPATTHHYYFERLTAGFPQVHLVQGVRYVEVDSGLYTAGGEMSGVDLALHLVAQYFGDQAAQDTADRMECQGTGWRLNRGVTNAAPITHEEWHGELRSGAPLQLHITVQGSAMAATIDSAALHAVNVPAQITPSGAAVRIDVQIPGHPATFAGDDNDADDTLTGTLTQDGVATPLILTKDKRPHRGAS
jgi:putative intracellular protease/amidase